MKEATKEKLDNFWYYHKVKIFAGLLLIIIVVVSTRFIDKKIEPDVQVGYLTDGRTLPEDTVKGINDFLASDIIDVNKDKINEVAFVPIQFGPKIDMDLVAGESQIIMMNGDSMRKFVKTGVLESLDDIVKKFKLDVSNSPEVITEADGADKAHVYALPLRNIKFLLKLGFPAEDYYLTVRVANIQETGSIEKNKNAFVILDRFLEEAE